MAKRKRLNASVLTGRRPAAASEPGAGAQETASGASLRAPIAMVSGDAAVQSAFEEVAEELQAAKAEGRMILRLPLDAIAADYLVRDRVAIDAAEMDVLKASLRARGQQTPIDVVALENGRYGLISGWRRLTALRALFAETADPAFAAVQALLRSPQEGADTYRAMIEENEIRADLSFYERARIAVKSVEQGIFPNAKSAVQNLFSAALAPKRSKIVAFTILVDALDKDLQFPAAIPEKLGLALVQALQNRKTFAAQLRTALKKAAPDTIAQERDVLDRMLRESSGKPRAPQQTARQVAPGILLHSKPRAVRLSGTGIDEDLVKDLAEWLASRHQHRNPET